MRPTPHRSADEKDRSAQGDVPPALEASLRSPAATPPVRSNPRRLAVERGAPSHSRITPDSAGFSLRAAGLSRGALDHRRGGRGSAEVNSLEPLHIARRVWRAVRSEEPLPETALEGARPPGPAP